MVKLLLSTIVVSYASAPAAYVTRPCRWDAALVVNTSLSALNVAGHHLEPGAAGSTEFTTSEVDRLPRGGRFLLDREYRIPPCPLDSQESVLPGIVDPTQCDVHGNMLVGCAIWPNPCTPPFVGLLLS